MKDPPNEIRNCTTERYLTLRKLKVIEKLYRKLKQQPNHLGDWRCKSNIKISYVIKKNNSIRNQSNNTNIVNKNKVKR